jgi:hypothetical protein
MVLYDYGFLSTDFTNYNDYVFTNHIVVVIIRKFVKSVDNPSSRIEPSKILIFPYKSFNPNSKTKNSKRKCTRPVSSKS